MSISLERGRPEGLDGLRGVFFGRAGWAGIEEEEREERGVSVWSYVAHIVRRRGAMLGVALRLLGRGCAMLGVALRLIGVTWRMTRASAP